MVFFLRILRFCAFGAIAGCSSALDERQIVESSSLGTVFFAEVVSVYAARTSTGFPLGYRSVPETFYQEQALNPDITFDAALRLRVIGSFLSVLGADVETKFASLRCLYVIYTDDEAAVTFVRRSVLGEFDDPFVDEFTDSDPFDEATSEEEFFGPDDDEQLQFNPDDGLIASDTDTRNILTLAQACDRNAGPGTRVLITLNTDGATIQAITPEISEFFGTNTNDEIR